MSQCLYILTKLKVAFYRVFLKSMFRPKSCVYILVGFSSHPSLFPAFCQLCMQYNCFQIFLKNYFQRRLKPWKIDLLCLHRQLQRLHCCSCCAAREYSLGKLVNYFSLEQAGNCAFLLQYGLCMLRH